MDKDSATYLLRGLVQTHLEEVEGLGVKVLLPKLGFAQHLAREGAHGVHVHLQHVVVGPALKENLACIEKEGRGGEREGREA